MIPTILYKSGKFFGVMLPKSPIYPSANQDTERAWRRYESDFKYYKQEVESLKASATTEIVNALEKVVIISEDGKVFHVNPYKPTTEVTEIKEGDCFPLPEGLSFKEEEMCASDVCTDEGQCQYCKQPKKVFRIVKSETKDELSFECKNDDCPHCNFEREFAQPEPEESQEELWSEAQLIVKKAIGTYSNDMIVDMARWATEALKEHFTIQRKKPTT